MKLLTQAAAAFSYDVQLGDAQFNLVYKWNTRFKFWTLSVYTSDAVPLFEGRRIVLGQPVFIDVVQAGMPQPGLFPFDSTGKLLTLGRGDLGNAADLYAI